MGLWRRLAVLIVVAMVSSTLSAEQAKPEKAMAPLRNLAPGVMTSVDPARELRESFSRHDVVELLAWGLEGELFVVALGGVWRGVRY